MSVFPAAPYSVPRRMFSHTLMPSAILFDFSLEEISHTDFRIEVQSRDLHGSLLAEANIVTEYEDKFIRKGFRINYLKAVLK